MIKLHQAIYALYALHPSRQPQCAVVAGSTNCAVVILDSLCLLLNFSRDLEIHLVMLYNFVYNSQGLRYDTYSCSKGNMLIAIPDDRVM